MRFLIWSGLKVCWERLGARLASSLAAWPDLPTTRQDGFLPRYRQPRLFLGSIIR
ncbi:hypothetical protein [Thiocapsa sp.]|uniref:hypothetical protein n=1 Tax=Thiocapsa sp. TaxID=2024551 RepID=UPI00359460FA